MSTFSYQIKEELCKKSMRKSHCILAELAGIVHTNSAISLGGAGAGIRVITEHHNFVTRVFSLVNRVFGVDCILSQSHSGLQKGVYTIKFVPKDFFQALNVLGITLTPSLGIDKQVFDQLTHKDCCKAAYLRGCFLGSGTMVDPTGQYHLEFVCDSAPVAKLLRETLQHLGANTKIIKRKEQSVVYQKDVQSIRTTLSVIGAHNSVLELENIRIVKDIRGHVNRQINWESANIDRTVRSAIQQLTYIAQIEATVGLAQLTPAVYEAAMLRRQHKEASLAELAEIAGISRSAFNNRMRKLAAFAKDLPENLV